MFRTSAHCKEYKNGNLTIKYDAETIQEAEKDAVLILACVLEEIDCDFFGETYCLNNFETGHSVYNAYSDLVYVFPWRLLDELQKGKTIRLHARKPDAADLEIINNEL